jgi:hypothetical protein
VVVVVIVVVAVVVAAVIFCLCASDKIIKWELCFSLTPLKHRYETEQLLTSEQVAMSEQLAMPASK